MNKDIEMNHSLDVVCGGCAKKNKNLNFIRCKMCKLTIYCSEKCRETDIDHHRPICICYIEALNRRDIQAVGANFDQIIDKLLYNVVVNSAKIIEPSTIYYIQHSPKTDKYPNGILKGASCNVANNKDVSKLKRLFPRYMEPILTDCIEKCHKFQGVYHIILVTSLLTRDRPQVFIRSLRAFDVPSNPERREPRIFKSSSK